MSDPGRTASGDSGEGTSTPQHSDGARLMAACGEHIDLVVDAWFDTFSDNTIHASILSMLLFQRRDDIGTLWLRPFYHAVRSRYVSCLCSPFNSIMVRSQLVSGSQVEGLCTPPRPPVFHSSSDLDIMYELNRVDWVFPDGVNSCSAKEKSTRTAPTADLGGPDSDPPPRLVITETENPGFVLLLQERRDDCPHQERLIFEANDVKRFLSNIRKLYSKLEKVEEDDRGPALPYSNKAAAMYDIAKYDDVPCLHVAVWFIPDEFFTRHRQYNWPPEAVRDNIRQFGLHLVPVGAPGSSTERFEFRISFSRAEILLASLLTDRQRHAVIAFKLCRALVPNGKMLKSYYVKTALLWLCEQTPKDDWTTVSQSVIKLLDFLEQAVDTGHLPCYFWSQINLLRFTSQGKRELMKTALHDTKQNLNTLLAAELCVNGPELQVILTQTTRQLTERQVRVCLARWNICGGIIHGLIGYLAMATIPEVGDVLAVMVHSQQLTSFDVDRLLEKYTYRRKLQFSMFKALTVAPADVTLQADMQRSIGPGFVWDAAPLLDLLTEDDLRCLLGDPDAVRAWLWRQQKLPETERPAGLPADLRSPRDLCDLLLNIPLLSRALREKVTNVWWSYQLVGEGLTRFLSRSQIEAGEVFLKEALDDASKWMASVFPFHNLFGMDPQTALRTAFRYGVEMRRLCNDPETVREHERRRRRFPDPWGLLHFLLRRPL